MYSPSEGWRMKGVSGSLRTGREDWLLEPRQRIVWQSLPDPSIKLPYQASARTLQGERPGHTDPVSPLLPPIHAHVPIGWTQPGSRNPIDAICTSHHPGHKVGWRGWRWRMNGEGWWRGQLKDSQHNVSESLSEMSIFFLDYAAQDSERSAISNLFGCCGILYLQFVLREWLCLRVRGRKENAKYWNLCLSVSVVSKKSFLRVSVVSKNLEE